MIAVDTNVLLRYLLCPVDQHNPQWQVMKAAEIIDQAHKVFISDIVMVESEWILETVFECSRKEIHTLIHSIANNTKFQFEDWATLNKALLDYIEYNKVDLSDCLIARRAINQGALTLYTFERNNKLGALPIATSISRNR
jgi:predicted nucleic-acid-binding protein